jgi:zinc protease
MPKPTPPESDPATLAATPGDAAKAMSTVVAKPEKPGPAPAKTGQPKAAGPALPTAPVPTVPVAVAARHAPEPLPKDLPAYGKERMPPPIHIEQRKLANGLTVWVLPREDGPPKVHFVLTVRGGLADDPIRQPGFSTMLADLLKEGTDTRDAFRIAQDLQSYGGDMQAEAGVDGITVSMSGLASNAVKVITLLSEIALQPSFPPHEVDQAKLKAMQSLVAIEADPDYQARRALSPLVYPGHPYHRVFPTESSLLSISPQMLQEVHETRFRPDRALLVVTGRIATDRAFQMAESVFGDWRAEGRAEDPTPRAATSAPARRVFVTREDSVQSAIRIGRPAVAADSPDYFPLQVANAVIGGGFRSRLNQNLREDKGFTYGAGSTFRAERAGGALVAYANVRNQVTGAAIGQFLREYRELGDKSVPEDELASTKHYLAGGYTLLNQQQAQVASALADYWLMGLPPQTLSDYVPKISAVDAAQVQAMARKYFSPKDQSIVVVGDEEVMGQLKPYGEFEQASK